MEPVLTTAAQGLTQLQQLGIAGVMLSLLLCLGFTGLWYFAKHCEKRTDASLTAFKEEAAQNREVIEKNTVAFMGVQTAIARIDGRLGVRQDG